MTQFRRARVSLGLLCAPVAGGACAPTPAVRQCGSAAGQRAGTSALKTGITGSQHPNEHRAASAPMVTQVTHLVTQRQQAVDLNRPYSNQRPTSEARTGGPGVRGSGGRPPGEHCGPRRRWPKAIKHHEPSRGVRGVAPGKSADHGEDGRRPSSVVSRLGGSGGSPPREDTADHGEDGRRPSSIMSRLGGSGGSPPREDTADHGEDGRRPSSIMSRLGGSGGSPPGKNCGPRRRWPRAIEQDETVSWAILGSNQ